MELHWGQGPVSGSVVCQTSSAAFPAWVDLCIELATSHGLRLVGGSLICAEGGGFVNRCVVAEPDGTVWFQDKLVLTQFEIDDWGLQPGSGQEVRDGLGVAICYDIEFARVVEPLADLGATLVAVPSFTETAHGHNRVHGCGAARSTEFQVVVAIAPLLGDLGHEPVPSTKGGSAVYAPCVPPFPPHGRLAVGKSLAAGEFDPLQLLEARGKGDVRNFHDQKRLRGATSPGA